MMVVASWVAVVVAAAAPGVILRGGGGGTRPRSGSAHVFVVDLRCGRYARLLAANRFQRLCLLEVRAVGRVLSEGAAAQRLQPVYAAGSVI